MSAHMRPNTTWLSDIAPLFALSSDPSLRSAERYDAILPYLMRLEDSEVSRLEYVSRAIIVREAMATTRDASTLDACRRVMALCGRAAEGYATSPGEWRQVRPCRMLLNKYAELVVLLSADVQGHMYDIVSYAVQQSPVTDSRDRLLESLLSAYESAICPRNRDATQPGRNGK